MNNIDISETARRLVRRHGESAVSYASERIWERIGENDANGAEKWIRIAASIRDLLRGEQDKVAGSVGWNQC